MITNEDYMKDSANLHHAYHMQFVTDRIRSAVDRMKDQIMKSTDPYLNDISLKIWDSISERNYIPLCEINYRINGRRAWSVSLGVCAAKAYANELRGMEIWEGRNKR